MKVEQIITIAGIAVAASAFAQEVRVHHYSDASNSGKVAVRAITPAHQDVTADGYSIFGMSFLPGCGWPLRGSAVYGLRLDLLMGQNHDVYGLDIGLLANFTDYTEDGIAVGGIFNSVGRSDGAFMVGGAFNYVKYDFAGVQVAVGYNAAEVECTGIQIAAVNNTARISGVQVGAFNRADFGTGLQIGVVNYSEALSGLQIGVVNVNVKSTLPVMPVLNGAF